MSTALQSKGQYALTDLVKQPRYADRFKEVLKDRTNQFVSSLIQVGNSLGKDCDANSIIASAMTAAALDLPIDKNLGFAWIVPYNKSGQKLAQFQMGYKGYIQLALRTGQYKRLNVCEIYEGELVHYNRVTGDLSIDQSKKTSDTVIGYASYILLSSGFEHSEYWTKEEVSSHASRYSQAFRANGNTPWKSHFDEMAMKTVLSMHIRKWGPMSIQVTNAHQSDGAVLRDIDADPEYLDNEVIPEAPAKKPRFEKPATTVTINAQAEPVAEPATENPEQEMPEDTSTLPVDENAADRKAAEVAGFPFAQSLHDQMTAAGVTVEAFVKWALPLGRVTEEDGCKKWASFMDISEAVAERLLADAKGIRNVIMLKGKK